MLYMTFIFPILHFTYFFLPFIIITRFCITKLFEGKWDGRMKSKNMGTLQNTAKQTNKIWFMFLFFILWVFQQSQTEIFALVSSTKHNDCGVCTKWCKCVAATAAATTLCCFLPAKTRWMSIIIHWRWIIDKLLGNILFNNRFIATLLRTNNRCDTYVWLFRRKKNTVGENWMIEIE